MHKYWSRIKYESLSNDDDPSHLISLSLLDSSLRLVPRVSHGPGSVTSVGDSEVDTVSLDRVEAEKDDSPVVSNPTDGPPSLLYPIETKHKSIFITWSIIILVNTILPVTIYYVLRYSG